MKWQVPSRIRSARSWGKPGSLQSVNEGDRVITRCARGDRVIGEQKPTPYHPITLSPSRLHRDLVDEAPQPILSRLERLHERVIGGVEVLGSVLVFRGIATTDVTADQAEAQMDPAV